MKSKTLFLVISLVVAFLAYANSLRNDLVWDDADALKVYFYDYSIRDFFFPKIGPGGYYRPMIGTLYAAEVKLWGFTAFGFHLTNVLLHVLTTGLVFLTALKIFKGVKRGDARWLSLWGAILFAVHPIHTESVAWISGRTDVLCGFFLLEAFYYFLLFEETKGLKYVFLSCFFFFFSLMSKEIGFSFLLLILLYKVLLSRKDIKKSLSILFPLMGTFLIYFLLRSMAVTGVAGVSSSLASPLALKNGMVIELISSYGFYIKKLFFPFNLSAFIPDVPRDTYWTSVSLLLLALTTLIVATSITKGRKISAFLLGFIVVTLLPSLATVIFKVAETPVAERYLYIPSLGFSILVPYWIFRALSWANTKGVVRPPLLTGIVLLPLITIFAWTTTQRNQVWRNNLTLWETEVKKHPNYGLPHNGYAVALAKSGKEDEAIEEFMKVLDPDVIADAEGRAIAANNLGKMLMERGNKKLAMKYFLKSINYNPLFPKPYFYIGRLYFRDAAEKGWDHRLLLHSKNYFQKSIRISPRFVSARLFLGKNYLLLGEEEKAKRELKEVIRLSPRSIMAKKAREVLEDIDEHRQNETK